VNPGTCAAASYRSGHCPANAHATWNGRFPRRSASLSGKWERRLQLADGRRLSASPRSLTAAATARGAAIHLHSPPTHGFHPGRSGQLQRQNTTWPWRGQPRRGDNHEQRLESRVERPCNDHAITALRNPPAPISPLANPAVLARGCRCCLNGRRGAPSQGANNNTWCRQSPRLEWHLAAPHAGASGPASVVQRLLVFAPQNSAGPCSTRSKPYVQRQAGPEAHSLHNPSWRSGTARCERPTWGSWSLTHHGLEPHAALERGALLLVRPERLTGKANPLRSAPNLSEAGCA